jgi:hypothetical protein
MDNVTFQTLVPDARQKNTGEPIKAEEASVVNRVDDALLSGEAQTYWERLTEAGFVDDDRRLLPATTRKQAMYIADLFADKLHLRSRWKPFQELWGINNLAQEKWEMQQTGCMPPRYKDIDRVFEV